MKQYWHASKINKTFESNVGQTKFLKSFQVCDEENIHNKFI